MKKEKWFTLKEIEKIDCDEDLYCLEVDSPCHQFLIGEMGVPTHNTEEGKAIDELKGECTMLIGSIARLGRAAGTHLVLATQRPDASILPGEIRDNMAVRIGCGPLKPNASQMILNSGIGGRIRGNPKGGIYVQVHGQGNMGQGFFAPPNWIDEYFAEHGNNVEAAQINSDMTISELPTEAVAKENFNALEDWDDDMEFLMDDDE